MKNFIIIYILLYLASCQGNGKGAPAAPIVKPPPSTPIIKVVTCDNSKIYTERDSFIDECKTSGVRIFSLTNSGTPCNSTFLCDGTNGSNGVNGSNGTNGTNGSNGLTFLLNFERSETLSECSGQHGTIFIGGLDSNKNNILDLSEISQYSYACDGENGTNGTNGTNGQDGEDGTSISEVIDPCGNGVGEDEVLLRFGTNFVKFYEKSGKRYLSKIEENTWITTNDVSKCKFYVNGGGIYYE